MRPAAPESSKCQFGSADNSPPALEGLVLVPNPAQSSSSGSWWLIEKLLGLLESLDLAIFLEAGFWPLPKSKSLTAWTALVVIAQQHGDSTTCGQRCLAFEWR